MNTRQLTLGALIAASVFIAMPKAHAQAVAAFPKFMATVTGRTTTVGFGSGGTAIATQAPTALTAGGGWTTASNYGYRAAAEAVEVGAAGSITVGGKAVPVGMTGSIPNGTILSTLAGCVTGGVVGCALTMAVPVASAFLSGEIAGSRINSKDGMLEIMEANCLNGRCPDYEATHPALDVQNAYVGSKAQACGVLASRLNAFSSSYSFSFTGSLSSGCGMRVVGKTDGKVLHEDEPYGGFREIMVERSPTWYPATPQQAKDALYNKKPFPGIVDELAKYGNINWPLGTPSITGPASVTGPKTTTRNADGSSTSTQDTTPITYDSGTATAGPTRTTTTRTNTDGTTSTTETTSDPGTEPTEPGTQEPEGTPTDTALPDLPKLYDPKYPQGLEGVWTEQKDKLKSTSLSQLVTTLMPNVGSGGSCPSWNVNLDFAGWSSYGTHNVAPPCEVWDWGRMIILVSALLLARALIFGG